MWHPNNCSLIQYISLRLMFLILREEYLEAVQCYRDVLRLADERKDTVRTDELQLLHTVHNLNEVLSWKPQGQPRCCVVMETIRSDPDETLLNKMYFFSPEAVYMGLSEKLSV